MTRQEWNNICYEVSKKMCEHIKNFVTPISRVLSDTDGEHLGSGSYFHFKGNKYLITNEHVARHLSNNPLTHKFNENDTILKLTNPMISLKAPIDVAICKIENSHWKRLEHTSNAIPFDRFSKTHSPVEGELLFFIGYSGERSEFYFNYLKTSGTPYLTQELTNMSDINEANSEFHFALLYSSDKATSIDDTSSLPDPHGFSGSLVWDTKVVACINEGTEWSPDLAMVTGIVWGWPSSAACILATKVEHLDVDELASTISNNF
jgi:hypothetical protein